MVLLCAKNEGLSAGLLLSQYLGSLPASITAARLSVKPEKPCCYVGGDIGTAARESEGED